MRASYWIHRRSIAGSTFSSRFACAHSKLSSLSQLVNCWKCRAFVPLALLVIISGCISGFPGSGGSGGVSITSMSFSPSSIKSNQLAKFSVSVQNTGDYNIENDEGYVYVFGLPDEWQISDKSDITSYSQQFSMAGIQNRGGKIFPGETKDFQWVLRAPQNLPKDEIFSYNAQARVCYPYKTKVWGTLEVMSEDAWLQNPPKEHQISAQQTKGPISVEFLSSQPLAASDSVKIKVRITNTGGGTVTTNPCSIFQSGGADDSANAQIINGLNKITLENSDCTLDDPDLYLQKGQSKETSITCAAPSLDNAPTNTGNFIMELSYTYYFDKSASISVTGTSEAAAGGAVSGGGAGGVPTVTLTDLCTKSCVAAKQTLSGSEARGMCRSQKESSSLIYPPGNTFGFQLLLAPLGYDELKNKLAVISKEDFSSIYSGNANSVTINDLKLHDARTGDFTPEDIVNGNNKPRADGTLRTNGLLDLTIKDLDSGTLTKQYTQAMFDADTDGDGLPDWFEEKYASKIISADSKDTDKNGVNDPDEMYKKGLTYMQEYLIEKDTAYRSLGIADYICKNYPTGQDIGGKIVLTSHPTSDSDIAACRARVGPIKLIDLASVSFNGKEYKPGSDADALKNLPTDSLKIIAIDGFSISDIAKSNPSRKIRSTIADINIGDIYVTAIPALTTNYQNFLKYGKCSDKYAPSQYSRDIICKCTLQSGNQLDTWQPSSADSTQCRATCKNKIGTESGECSKRASYASGQICKDSKVVEIRTFSGSTDLGCGSDTCVCIGKALATLSPQDVPIVCKQ
ncbi:Uncharacterised protein [uncultured archaeon]|nr:Uncharacterised protein [uncultured archaeon]